PARGDLRYDRRRAPVGGGEGGGGRGAVSCEQYLRARERGERRRRDRRDRDDRQRRRQRGATSGALWPAHRGPRTAISARPAAGAPPCAVSTAGSRTTRGTRARSAGESAPVPAEISPPSSSR